MKIKFIITTMQNCSNCDREIKWGGLGIFNTNEVISNERISFINQFIDKTEESYCTKCHLEPLSRATKNFNSIKKEIKEVEEEYMNSLPVITLDNPQGWNYRSIGLVKESKSVNTTYATYEKREARAFLNLKINTYNLGGNAVLGAKISRSIHGEGGSERYGRITIYGTAVEVLNTEVFPEDYHQAKRIYESFEETRQMIAQFEKQ